MSRRRLFTSELPQGGGEVVLDPQASHHARVLRLAEGDEIELFDGSGGSAEATILEVLANAVRCVAQPPTRSAGERAHVALIQCVPKGPKLESIVRMTTELGVSSLHLAESERVVARTTDSRVDNRMARLDRIAKEAARQSGQSHVPILWPPAPLLTVARRANESATKVVLAADAPAPLGPIASSTTTWLVVGPEGGLTDGEIDSLVSMGFEERRLGATVLRVETAATVAVALTLDRLAYGPG
jgi:16S rRNA (uracil1498-N3)-methyltransferase